MDEAQVDALIDDLESATEWRSDVGDVVRGLLAGLPATPLTDVQRARLTLLGCQELTPGNDAAVAAVVIVEVRDRAVADGHRSVQVRAERALSALLRDVGDPAAALEHAVAAMALDGEHLDPTTRCRVHVAMADALAVCGSFDDARLRYREASERARVMSTPWLSLVVLNNWAYTELMADRLEAAAELVEQVLAIARQHGVTLTLVTAGTVAEVLHVLGRSDEAVTMLREHLSERREQAPIAAAGAWLTLAQIQRELGDLEATDASLSTAERLTTAHGLHGLRVEAAGSRAELLAARGDHAGAYALQCRFHEQTLELRSGAADARAQTLRAILEVDQARREGARYREMSHRDPLTRLHNRRHLDADLDARLARGDTLTIAMVDLDHFKTVNDTYSHAAGDAVLVRIATLLTKAAAAIPGAYAARLGGEEFLLVLPHHDLTRAHTAAETLRRTIATTDWSDIAPGLPITASTGLATTAAGAPLSRADLLRTADTHLYAAKTAGRNRVEPSVDHPGPHDARGAGGF